MKLSHLIELLGNNLVEVTNLNGKDPEVNDVVSNSRLLKPGNLFICLQGTSFDSHLLAPELQERGAAALIAEKKIDVDLDIPIIYVKSSRLAEAHLYMEINDHPYKKLTTIGVTGTNGKTTVTTLINHILETFQRKSALVGTVKNVIGDYVSTNPKNTTPGPATLAKYMKMAVEKNLEYFVMEVSSHGLAMHRVDGMRFDVAVLTNVTRDHLDFHASFEDYYRTKLRIFNLLKPVGKAVVNSDNVNIGDIKLPRDKIITYGFGNESDFRMENLEISRTGMYFTVETPFGSKHKVYTRLVGEHNAYNVTATIATMESLNYDTEHILEAISTFSGVPGRFEFVEEATKYGFDVLVDFAHTPDALEKLLKTAKKLSEGRIIIVFGAGGDADKGKRPLMGEIASRFADVVILTSDDPKKEDPEEILNDIEAGISKTKPYLVIPDRREAISVALTLANRQDTVLIAGRGHEDYQAFADYVVAFNDKRVVKEILDTKFRRHAKR
ncbi:MULTISPECIES: UDP-N-acetylmuramoyl-L-alanyl-D-glutamate--2,6-diaminopimelate ligase [Kosmotoga]|uniref:UDP-N-acetylmuramyl-tripeptide synthetase n=1 Tax=Kosmotoga olearia (strain ATCC BAA-1733 / DSM 21960 / TBF 19.5.1) TaxID=521045 RepID=C5CDR4_KOSOT|nr:MULTISPECIES: UDP-N-acetylmuramoyl-L-alanyl-D-glutamate--2,6-diaminopimelate ligase [Kosmotoga]ACR80076.1 UDP-N-acetylmuramyl-tripeptide synthetase [Kosmotoga olearia TBF 19.5.1]MDI3523644.1 UDP-N-acetylmuramoyl-L-alanyl-D-glutamate--2,6-diaminopimelate ligase [Kosmotoga sp.]MDK2953536.1 UDP-N-acetylmuramoyl-L-alanyl-D-glutamate--2,6-diaminopimelate ligase [Kosmotoga sp.]OAA20426.1 UDP-N-acetylmuramyl peptide synthase [Kosmotoga sp. DU53]